MPAQTTLSATTQPIWKNKSKLKNGCNCYLTPRHPMNGLQHLPCVPPVHKGRSARTQGVLAT
eukprot:2911768-Pyramimonas_sp.AAC.1